MERNLIKFVWRHSKPQQLYLLAVIALSWPINYLLYDIPKDIVNRAIVPASLGEGPPYGVQKFGLQLVLDDPIILLAILCTVFLTIVIISNFLKYHIGIYRGRLAERLLRRIRYMLYHRVLRFPQLHFRRVSQGELVLMINKEAEEVGNFTGAAIVHPIYLGGQLMVTLGFILVQNPYLALAAASFYPVQAWIIPRLQRRVSELNKLKIGEIRRVSEHIGESVSGSIEIHGFDTSKLELARFSDRLGRIFDIRYQLFRRRFTIKFLNNFLDKLAPFLFYLIGGSFVITGDLTIGALLAVIAAHKDMSAPWKETLTWYQDREVARVKYEEIIKQFDPPNLIDEELMIPDTPEPAMLSGKVELSNVGLVDEDDVRRLANISFDFGIDQHIAVIGGAGSGKEQLALILARLVAPTTGRILVGGIDLATLPEAVTGRRIAYVGPSTFLQSATVRDNLVYALKHRPTGSAAYGEDEANRRKADLEEARRAGNIDLDIRADWIDLAEAGVEDEAGLIDRLIEILTKADMADEVYQMGLRGSIDPELRPDLAANILKARRALRDRLREPEFAELVEPFDVTRYNTNASVAENLLFGTPVGDDFGDDHLAEHEYIREVLRQVGLYDEFLEIGHQVAETMVEIFADLPPGHEFFEQFSFISSDDLPEFKEVLQRTERDGLESLSVADRRKLLSLPFKLTPARHRLGVIDEERQRRLLEARRYFADNLPAELRGAVEFFDAGKYNNAASIQDNILFGKIAFGHAQGAQRIGELIATTLDALGVRASVMEAGLAFHVGIGGSRLSAAQRQKIGLARALLRQADLLIVNEATDVVDSATEARIVANVLAHRAGRGLLWTLNRAELAEQFEVAVVMEEGRVKERGPVSDLNNESTAFDELRKSA